MDGSRLIALPRELRDLIYDFYLRCDGYTYESNSRKLLTVDLEKINLSLMYTCEQITTEMYGLPLQTNTVSFSTTYHKNLRSNAGLFGALLKQLYEVRTDILDRSQHFITPKLMSEVGILYRLSSPFVADTFPQIILDIINGNSIVSCNFPIGPCWDDKEVEALIDAHKEWSSDK